MMWNYVAKATSIMSAVSIRINKKVKTWQPACDLLLTSMI